MSKYHNTKVTIHGETFDSKKEAARWQDLQILQRAGLIEQLKRQVRFEILPKVGKFRAKYYIADFTYLCNGKLVVEDAKGVRTPVYQLKKHLMMLVHKIEIKEV